MKPVLILRPQPGSGESAARAASLGLLAVEAPLFTISPLPWEAPAPEAVASVMLTSANAARCAGSQLAAFTRLPCHAVGSATAAAARAAGFTDVSAGEADGKALLAAMAAAGVGSALHLCGREHIGLSHPEVRIERRVVYASDAVSAIPVEAVAALRDGAVALLHSPRAAALFARLVDAAGLDRARIRLAAISGAAAEAAGGGWRTAARARVPADQALLELAAKLCKTDGEAG